jgi:hypothetical protein
VFVPEQELLSVMEHNKIRRTNARRKRKRQRKRGRVNQAKPARRSRIRLELPFHVDPKLVDKIIEETESMPL